MSNISEESALNIIQLNETLSDIDMENIDEFEIEELENLSESSIETLNTIKGNIVKSTDTTFITESYDSRKDIPDELFGLPKIRKFRLDDAAHVSRAIGYFRTVKSKKLQKELAENIIKAIRKFDMHPHVSKTNPFYKYLPEDLISESISLNEGILDLFKSELTERKERIAKISDTFLDEAEAMIKKYKKDKAVVDYRNGEDVINDLFSAYSDLEWYIDNRDALDKKTVDLIEPQHLKYYKRINSLMKLVKSVDPKGYRYVYDMPLSESSVGLGSKKRKTIHGVKDVSSVVIKDGKVFVPVYVVLTKNDTTIGKGIRAVTGAKYNHASISTDHTLSKMYSFGGTGEQSGFIIESIHEGKLKELIDNGTEYALYVTFIARDKYERMELFLNEMLSEADKWKYNTIGLVRYLMGIAKDEADKMFCSEFVAKLLQQADENLIRKHPALTAPMDTINEKFYEISNGFLRDYDSADTRKKVSKIRRHKTFNQYLTENAVELNSILYTSMDMSTLTSLTAMHFSKFYPSQRYPLAFIKATSLGDMRDGILDLEIGGRKLRHLGLIQGYINHLPEIYQHIEESLEIFYNTESNFYKAGYYDVSHIFFSLLIQECHAEIINCMNSDNYENLESILEEWEVRVCHLYSLYMDAESEKDRNILKQGMHELLWWFGDNPFDEEVVKKNIYKMALSHNDIRLLNEDSIIDLTTLRTKLVQLISTVGGSDNFLLPYQLQYPILDAESLLYAAQDFDSVDADDKDTFIENFLKHAKIHITSDNHKIPEGYSICKYLPGEYIYSERYNILTEGIKTKVYNFSLDDDGNILIEKKETSDFKMHYGHSVKLLKTYKTSLEKGIMIDGVKHELCKLYFMSKLIERRYLVPRSQLSKDDQLKQKEMLDTRAGILNTFNLYMGLVLELEPSFNFSEYFNHSKYGDAIKVTKKEMQATAEAIAYISKFL